MKNRKILIGIITIILLIIAIVVSIIINNKQNEEKAKQTLQDIIGLINEKNYEAMYEKVASINMTKEDFINRNKNIYEGIDSDNIKIEVQKIEKQDNKYQISYHEKMFTAAGEVEFDNQVIVNKEEGEYKLEWSSKFIFPRIRE